HFIGRGIAIQLRLRFGGTASSDHDIVIHQKCHSTGDHISAGMQIIRPHVVVAQLKLRYGFECHRARCFHSANTSRRSQMIADAVCPAESRAGDDFLVINPFALEAAFPAMRDMSLPRHGTKLAIGRHGNTVHNTSMLPPPLWAEGKSQSVPLRACSRSMASNRALKFPLPKLREPWRSITSKKSVGRSQTGLVKICKR